MTAVPPRPEPKSLNKPSDAGGTSAELVYASWHRRFGQRLKAKYRDVGTAKRNRGRKAN